MISRLGLVLVFLFCLMACERLSNRIDQAALACGDDIRDFPESRFIDPASSPTLDPAAWQGVGLTDAGFKALPKSSRGCLIVPKGFAGPLFLRHQSEDLGASYASSKWPLYSVQKLVPLEAPEGLSRDSLSLSCGTTLSNQFAAPYKVDRQSSAQLHLYEIRYELLDASGRILVFGEKAVDATRNSSTIDLPPGLSDGKYELRYGLYDVFDDIFASVKPKTLSCALQLDTKAPQVEGFQENLPQLTYKDQAYREVSPGQALNFKVADEGDKLSETQLHTCIYVPGTSPCSDFTPLAGPLYAPDEGSWIVRYYAEDRAGNRTTPADFTPLAVMHRETMQSIQNLLSLARLETERGQSLLSNKYLLEAYSAYYGLKLPLERDPLSTDLGLTFSEVSRSQHIFAEVRDHKQAIVKLSWLGAQEENVATLDSQGVFVAREKQGPLIVRFEEVADFASSADYEIVLLFKDGSIQFGLSGARTSLPAALKPRLFVLQGSNLLLADDKRLSLLEIRSPSQLKLRWQTALASTPLDLMLSLDQGLAMVAGAQEIRSFDLQSARAVQTSAWNPNCIYSKGIEAKGHAFFIALKTGPQAQVEEFHCELLRWDGRTQAVRVAHEKVLNPDDFVHPPADYRFEEVTTLAYSPRHQWLAFGRDTGPSFVIYDLKKDFAIAYENVADPTQSLGAISALGFSADGEYFATSLSPPQLQAFVWKLGEAPDLLSYPWQDPLSVLQQQPRVVENLLLDAKAAWLLTSDQGRQVRYYKFRATLLPRFDSELPPSLPLSGESDKLIVQVFADRIETADPYGRQVKKYERPSGEVVAVLQDASGKGLLSLDRSAKLWQTADDGSWRLAFDASSSASASLASCDSLLPSLSRRKLLLNCLDAAQQSTLVLLEQVGTADTWDLTLKLPIAARRLAWNPLETSFSVLTPTSVSLWSSSGQKLLEQTGKGLISEAAYLPFSADGSRWLTRVDRTLTVWDLASLSPVKPAWTWEKAVSSINFAGKSSDRLWLTYPSSSRGKAVVEVGDDGKVLREFGDFAGSIRHIFEREGAPWAFDNEGRVYRLREAQEGPTSLISIKSGEGETLLGVNQSENFLLTRDNQSKLGVLFLAEDPRQLQALCTWLAPMIASKSDPSFAPFESLCQAGADNLASSR